MLLFCGVSFWVWKTSDCRLSPDLVIDLTDPNSPVGDASELIDYAKSTNRSMQVRIERKGADFTFGFRYHPLGCRVPMDSMSIELENSRFIENGKVTEADRLLEKLNEYRDAFVLSDPTSDPFLVVVVIPGTSLLRLIEYLELSVEAGIRNHALSDDTSSWSLWVPGD